MKKDIAIFVNTFLRDDLIPRFVDSCEKHIPNGRLYITDNGRMNSTKMNYYKELKKRGHIIDIKEEFNYWWRKAFNEKISKLQDEKYVLKIDDDFIFFDRCNIKRFKELLESDTKIGLIGGQVWQTHRNVASDYIFDVVEKEDNGKYLLKYSEIKEKGRIYCDFVPDFWMARREIFEDIRMAEDLKPAQGGHEHFFRTIYEKRIQGRIDWRVAYTHEVRVEHEKEGHQTEEYKKHRSSGLKDYHKNIKVIRPGHEKQDREA